MKPSLVLIAAITTATSQLSPAQPPPATLPSSTASELNQVAANNGPLQLRSLQAVLNVRERRQDWHTAAQQAAERIRDSNLRNQFNQRLSGLVPVIAKALIDKPQEDALVTVAVYRDPAHPQKQAMLALTFDGLGAQIGQGFFANVIAGMPQAPQADGIPQNLSLDTEATSYLVFFLGKGQLLAGDIAHPVMGRSIVALTNKQREADQREKALAAAPSSNRPSTPPLQPDVTSADVNTVQPGDNYINANAYPMTNDGYDYPTAVGVPIVILPGDYPATADATARQRQRQAELQRRYQHNPYGITPQFGNAITPQSGNVITPQSGNYITPQSGNYVTPQSGNYVSPRSGNNVTPSSRNNVNPQPGNRPSGPTQFPKAGEPGGPPAKNDAPAKKDATQQPTKSTEKSAPQHPAKTNPPQGAPGGPPAQPEKK